MEAWALGLLAALVACFYLWSSQQPANAWIVSTKEPLGYYPLETAGFRSGHLYAALEPNPSLLALKDPYDPAANAPYRVHDMSLYKGHYYLYFGVTPVLILFWPVAAVTGRYVSEPFAVGLFCAGAIGVGMALLFSIRRRYFPGAPFAVLLLGWLCIAFATPLSLLVEAPRVYEVPISCAIFLQTLMFAALYRAVASPARPFAWMAAAGLFFGLSVGARPNYLASFAVLILPVAFLAWSRNAPGADRRRYLLKGLIWTFLPAALCGCGLLYYNWARFGSVSEFGMHYQLAGENVTQLKAMSARYLLPHVRFYLFNPGEWQSYFPFFSSPSGQPSGLVRYIPWIWLMPLPFLIRPNGPPETRRRLITVGAALACAFVANMALLACFFGTTARYPGDFANAGLILAGVGALAAGQRAASCRGRSLTLLLSGMALISFLFTAAVFVGWIPFRDALTPVARAANWPRYAWQRAHGANFGGIRLTLLLPENVPALAEPLIETGLEADQKDRLEISYLPANRARLSFFHAGTGEFPSKDFAIPADRRIVVDARFGSLLPPFGHPAFSGWSRSGYDNAKRNLRLTVDGVEVLRASLDCYDSSPANTRLGRLGWFRGECSRSSRGVSSRCSGCPWSSRRSWRPST